MTEPYFKYPGGKRRLVKEIYKFFPKEYNNYYEPFLGAGAVFFGVNPKNAYISDINEELINIHLVTRDHPEELIEDLKKHEWNKDYYISIRDIDRTITYSTLTNIERASRMLYLTKSAFNGLWRHNSKGYFNSSCGIIEPSDKSFIEILNIEKLLKCSKHLKNARGIGCHRYEEIFPMLKEKDLVYIDSPYYPLSKTSDFTKYSKEGFNNQDHQNLRDFCDNINNIGAYFIASNSGAKEVIDLYKKYNIDQIDYYHKLGGGKHKNKVKELIIRNFEINK